MKKTFLLSALLFSLSLAFLNPSFIFAQTAKENPMQKNTVKTIYFAGGCFWGIEKLFESINGVTDAESGYANGKSDITPTYEKVVRGGTEFKETVKVEYDPSQVRLEQLLTAFFYVIDPTIKNRQGNDIGTQYQTGIYYTDEQSKNIVEQFVELEKKKHKVFAVEAEPLKNFYTAEEYHQNYLDKNPQGYCHIVPNVFKEINEIIKNSPDFSQKETKAQAYRKQSREKLQKKLTPLQFEVTQNAATERAFTGEYWNFYGKGIYVDITTGEPLFSSMDKFKSSCGWPSFQAPINKNSVEYKKDTSFGMVRTEVKSKIGDSHLGHVFEGEPESPNGVRYCINSASLKFIPYEEMEKQGYGDLLYLFDEKK